MKRILIYEATNFGEFLRKIAIDYVRYGYFFYSVGIVPQRKDSKIFDEKILKKYEISFHRTTRARRKKEGIAVFAYVRFGYKMVLLSTEGDHPAFETWDYQDCRKNPIYISGYTIGIKNQKVNVQMSEKRVRALKKLLSSIALHNESKLTDFFKRMNRIFFPGIIRQEYKLLTMVNKKRKSAGLPRIRILAPTDNQRR